MKVGKKNHYWFFCFCFSYLWHTCLVKTAPQLISTFLYYISTFDSSQQPQQLRRPSVSVKRQVTLSWFWYNHEKKVRKEKMMFQMSCNSKIVVKHIRHGITKTLPSASALTHPFSLCLYMNISSQDEKRSSRLFHFWWNSAKQKKHIETISVNNRENNM